jgi:adenine-specific DNA methylase
MAIEKGFDVGFVAKLTAEEKQIQQNYRPVIGVHKWFARRPGALFRSLLLSEFAPGPLATTYGRSNDLAGLTIADPFMGGGTSLFEANRLSCNVVGFDINPMAYWVVRQELAAIDREAFRRAAEEVIRDVEEEIGDLYETKCIHCKKLANVKYFLWVKTQRCGRCDREIDLFPGYQVAHNVRHTHFVLHCPCCKQLVELEAIPPKGGIVACHACAGRFDWAAGPAKNNRYRCVCGHEGRYPAELRREGPPRHRLFGIEYHCERCGPARPGRLFKTADRSDLERYERASARLEGHAGLVLPDDEIPDGDETKRLHRWGYSRFREMFNRRQLLSLGLLLQRIKSVEETESRHALATVFSDSLRYQNMLCRYDVYALKCQDIFAVHGFPVGLVQCENNVLGIPGVGSGAFRHFVEKYDRAKAYCETPFETIRSKGGKKRIVPVPGERIAASFVSAPAELKGARKALLASGSIEDVAFPEDSFDAVFTDPPYYDNVQYAELMDFCFAWLRLLLTDVEQFAGGSTRSGRELTGNVTQGRDLAHFTEGLSRVFSAAAAALKPGGPFAFTYHHNDVEAYVPVIVALLDAGLICTATLPCPAEMSASLHINGTGSSTVDTILVSRRANGAATAVRCGPAALRRWLGVDRESLDAGGMKCTRGDLYCLALGHLARVVVSQLRHDWESSESVEAKMSRVADALNKLVDGCQLEAAVGDVFNQPFGKPRQERLPFGEALLVGPDSCGVGS